ncbi:hypothetical protein ATK30_6852 [Amycolatopsis echigonensis]|uniref:Uncharacterized protein n=1 Tax=Amycolatopsis echigonensis TaxID=2576905 RepID=A0A2N3WPX4_9PSEU|nr:hypothetical protein [Amycolatopsis niigatensis]PKV95919.1 hypothetical protein ATK30_6852 [Amycolatopsis niigatensis]
MLITAYQGQSVALTGEFFTGGAVVDPATVTVAIADPTGAVELAATSAGVSRESTGVYDYTWTVPAAAPLGNHVVTWQGTSPALTVQQLLAVTAPSSATWCQLTDVPAITGVTVDLPTLLQAGITIDVACGRPYAVDVAAAANARIGSRDLYWLKTATAYQAAWLATQVDAMTRVDALAVQTGRRMLMLRDTALFLAPLARRAIQHVSWLRDRSVHVQSGLTDPAGALGANPLSAGVDALFPWSTDEGGM